MITSIPCPGRQELTSLLSGQLPFHQVERLAAHLEDCARCAQLADQLSIEDPLVGAVQPGGMKELELEKERIDHLIHSLCLIDPGKRNSSGTETALSTLWDMTCAFAPANRHGFLGRVGPYWVQTRLGAGGMGEVYLARQERPNRAVALKILKARAGGRRDLLARFRSEADTAARLSHPNIVQVYEAGETADVAFIAMELVEGESLAAHLGRAVFAPKDAATLLSRLAQAVHFAHLRGVIHRDLKPSNVLLDRDGTPKLSDFGLAKVTGGEGADQTTTGAVIGTPAYMAPEQVSDGKAVGPAADVYGLGAILYECVTGRPPFKAASPLETLEQVRTLEPIPPRQLQQLVDRDLETICLKCLEKDPLRRYPSAVALSQDLDRFLRREPIRARRIGPFTRVWKLARRKPTIAALILIINLLIIGLFASILTYTVRLRTEVDRSNANAGEARRQQTRTSANYRSARLAMALMLRRLEERRTEDIPRLKEVKLAQLEDALTFYEEVLREFDDTDPVVQLDAAGAAAEAGQIQFSLGRTESAVKTFQRAIALYEGLPAELRTGQACRSGLIHCYNHLAELSKDQEGMTEQFLLKALAEAELLAPTVSTNLELLNIVANVLNNLGGYFQGRGDLGRAVVYFRRAVEIHKQSFGLHSEDEGYRADLGESLSNLGHTYVGTNQAEQAVTAFQQSQDLLQPLVDAHPGDERYTLSLAALLINWGNLAMRTDVQEALKKYNRAVDLADRVLKREPRDVIARARCLQAHGARALALDQAGRILDALNDWDRVVELANDSERPGHRVNRAILLCQARRFHDAAAESLELVHDPRVLDYQRYNLACILALTADPQNLDFPLGTLAGLAAAEARAAAAINLLRQLRSTGFFTQSGKGTLLTQDPDLAALRSRTDFQSLLRDTTVKP
jgi:serine/threonine protein kinase